MVDADLSTKFQEICKRATIAQQKVEDASRNQLGSNVSGTHRKASDTADHHARVDTGQDAAPEPWQEIRDKWRSHRAKVRKHVKKQKSELDAVQAVQNAGTAESYAKEAIEFALDAIDEAEYAVLDAVHARATANAPVS